MCEQDFSVKPIKRILVCTWIMSFCDWLYMYILFHFSAYLLLHHSILCMTTLVDLEMVLLLWNKIFSREFCCTLYLHLFDILQNRDLGVLSIKKESVPKLYKVPTLPKFKLLNVVLSTSVLSAQGKGHS